MPGLSGHAANVSQTRASLVAQLVKNLPAMRETPGSISGLGRSPGEGDGYPLQYSCLENSMDCIIHGVAKSQTRLGAFHFNLIHQKEELMLPAKLTACLVGVS